MRSLTVAASLAFALPASAQRGERNQFATLAVEAAGTPGRHLDDQRAEAGIAKRRDRLN